MITNLEQFEKLSYEEQLNAVARNPQLDRLVYEWRRTRDLANKPSEDKNYVNDGTGRVMFTPKLKY